MPVRDPDIVCVLDPLMVWVAVRLPVTVADMDRLPVILDVSPLEELIEAVTVPVFVIVIEAVRLLVRERLPVRDPVTVPVPERVLV